jgi:TonB-dependent SusC/RagA subfamily outer membrane receptor
MKRSSRRILAVPLVVLTAVPLAGCSTGRGQPAGPEADRPGTTITARDIEGRPAARIEEVMVGKFSGVQVFQGPDGLVVRIRGASSVYGSNDPLYVIDDMVVQPAAGGALVGLNPNDIEKIEVLKDIGQTARWGVQGANGVVLITTKRR